MPDKKPPIAPDAPLTAEEIASAASYVRPDGTPSSTHVVISPAPEPIKWPTDYPPKGSAPAEPFNMPLPPQKAWLYRNPDGSLFGAVARWDFPATKKHPDAKKIVLPCVYTDLRGVPQFEWAGFGAIPSSRPPLYAEQLSAFPMAPVLIVLGEKTADAAKKFLPDGWLVTTFQGGDNAVTYTDWSILAGHTCVIWPDLDGAPTNQDGSPLLDPQTGRPRLPSGERCAITLLQILHGLGIRADIVPVYGPRFRMFPRTGWDLADPLPEGIQASGITAWLTRTLASAYLPEDARPEAPSTPAAPDAAPTAASDNIIHLPTSSTKSSYVGSSPKKTTTQRNAKSTAGISHTAGSDGTAGLGVDTDLRFQALGYLSEPTRFFFLGARSQAIHEFSTAQICKDTAMLELVPDVHYWAAQYGSDGNGVPWKRIGAELMQKCYAVGMFDAEHRRGRGAWLDRNRVVFHAGDHLLIDGHRVNPSQVDSRYIYTRAPQFFDDLAGVEPLSDDEAKQLLTICRLMPWEHGNRLLGDLSAGLIATAAIGGALRWRSHGWWSGQSGSGKSWFLENVVARCLGDLAIYPTGESTEAGIRQFLRGDARPVIFDEAEGKGQAGVARRDAIINLMRSSASDGRGAIFKGSAGHDSAAFQIRSTFMLASIDVGIREAADETRCLVLTLANQQGYTSEQQQQAAERFARIQTLVAALPHDFPARLLARMIRLVPIIRSNIETLSTALTSRLSTSGTRRIGDLVGTPMAGVWALQFQTPLTDADIETFIGKYDWSPFSRTKDVKEDREVLDYMLSRPIRVNYSNKGATSTERPIGEIIMAVHDPFNQDHGLDEKDCFRALASVGIRYDRDRKFETPAYPGGGCLFSTKHPEMDRLMANSGYPSGYTRVLGRNVAARQLEGVYRFGSHVSKAIYLPISAIMPDDPEIG